MFKNQGKNEKDRTQATKIVWTKQKLTDLTGKMHRMTLNTFNWKQKRL